MSDIQQLSNKYPLLNKYKDNPKIIKELMSTLPSEDIVISLDEASKSKKEVSVNVLIAKLIGKENVRKGCPKCSKRIDGELGDVTECNSRMCKGNKTTISLIKTSTYLAGDEKTLALLSFHSVFTKKYPNSENNEIIGKILKAGVYTQDNGFSTMKWDNTDYPLLSVTKWEIIEDIMASKPDSSITGTSNDPNQQPDIVGPMLSKQPTVQTSPLNKPVQPLDINALPKEKEIPNIDQVRTKIRTYFTVFTAQNESQGIPYTEFTSWLDKQGLSDSAVFIKLADMLSIDPQTQEVRLRTVARSVMGTTSIT
jgi:hypothetical protein